MVIRNVGELTKELVERGPYSRIRMSLYVKDIQTTDIFTNNLLMSRRSETIVNHFESFCL